MGQFAGQCRFVWNKALAMQKDRLDRPFKDDRKIFSVFELCKFVTLWRQSEEFGFLSEAPCSILQQTLRDLDRALKDCFDKKQPNKKFPVLKRKGVSTDSFRIPSDIKVDGNRVFVPKVGWLRFFKSREIQGTMRNMTVSRKGKHWFFSIQVEMDVEIPPAKKGEVGIDMGIANTFTFSDGRKIDGAHGIPEFREKLAKAQRKLARQVKFSQNWIKQKRKIQKLHIGISNRRNDRNHWVSHKVSQSFGLVALEDLAISNMIRSAKGDAENPGTNVKAKAGLNRSILDQGWGEFKRVLEYKLEWAGGLMVEVNPRHTSQKCHACGHVDKENRKSQSTFLCVSCGHSEHADVNAAKNILAAGHAVLACESNRKSGRKQELLKKMSI